MNNTDAAIFSGFPAIAPQAMHLLEDCACFRLRRASRTITRHFDEIMEPAGLRVTQFNILAAVDEAGSLTISRLAADLGMDASTIARGLKPLVRNGLLVCSVNRDRRCKTVRLSPEGSMTLAAAVPLWFKANELLRQIMSADIISETGKNLSRLVDGLEQRGRLSCS